MCLQLAWLSKQHLEARFLLIAFCLSAKLCLVSLLISSKFKKFDNQPAGTVSDVQSGLRWEQERCALHCCSAGSPPPKTTGPEIWAVLLEVTEAKPGLRADLQTVLQNNERVSEGFLVLGNKTALMQNDWQNQHKSCSAQILGFSGEINAASILIKQYDIYKESIGAQIWNKRWCSFSLQIISLGSCNAHKCLQPLSWLNKSETYKCLSACHKAFNHQWYKCW